MVDDRTLDDRTPDTTYDRTPGAPDGCTPGDRTPGAPDGCTPGDRTPGAPDGCTPGDGAPGAPDGCTPGDGAPDDCVVRVLGPVDVLTTAGPQSVGGPQARTVLAALAIGAGHAVSVDLLHRTLWGDHPPASADNTLQSYISDLRRLLGTDAVERVDRAYELDIDAHRIDAVRFEHLLAQALAARDRPADCSRLARAALRLWRGRPFGDLADDEAFRREAYRLDELRLAAMEIGIEADLALGRHELAVSELEVLVEEHPHREHLWHLLIEALAASGRRAEALQAGRRLRRVLGEVGLQPSDEFVKIEEQIREGHRPSVAGSDRDRS